MHSKISFLLKDLPPNISLFLRCNYLLQIEVYAILIEAKRKGKKEKARYGQCNPGTPSAGKNSLHDFEPILPKITLEVLWPRVGPRYWVSSYKPYSKPGHTEVQHSKIMSVVCLYPSLRSGIFHMLKGKQVPTLILREERNPNFKRNLLIFKSCTPASLCYLAIKYIWGPGRNPQGTGFCSLK